MRILGWTGVGYCLKIVVKCWFLGVFVFSTILFVVVGLCLCFCVFVVVWLCFCGCNSVVEILWWCGCVFLVVWLCFCGGVVVFSWLCFCGGVVVSLWFCGGVFVFVFLCFCDGVVGCVFVVVWLCFCVFVIAFLGLCGCVFVVVFLRFVGGAPVSKKRPLRISRPDWMHASYVLERPVMIRYVCAYVGMPSAWFCRPMFPQTTWLSCSCSDTWTKAKQNNDMLQRPKALKRVF